MVTSKLFQATLALFLFSSSALAGTFEILPRAAAATAKHDDSSKHHQSGHGHGGGKKKYAPLAPPLDTPWTAEAPNDGHPWPDHPRPQLTRDFDGSKSHWHNLNGVWDFIGFNTSSLSDPRNPKEGEIPKEGQFKREILVPFCMESGISGIMERSNFSWYRREFTTGEVRGKKGEKGTEKSGERTLINFQAVDWEATVFINGKKAGYHAGGYSRFSVDVTSHLKSDPDAKNELVVYVFDPTDTDRENFDQPIGKQKTNWGHIWYTPCSGIWQTVWAETVPTAYVYNAVLLADMNGNIDATIYTNDKDQFPGTKPPASRPHGHGHGHGHGSGSGSGSHGDAHHGAGSQHHLGSGSDHGSDSNSGHGSSGSSHHGSGSSSSHHHASGGPVKITITDVTTQSVLGTGSGTSNKKFSFSLSKGSKIQTWSPDTPVLYPVKIQFGDDVVESYVGFRTIEKKEVNGVVRPVLNGEFVFQFGPLDQGFWPDGIYTPPTREAMEFDLKTLKELGMNMLRKHIKVEPDLFFHACDKLGLLLWQDMPSMNNDIPSPTDAWQSNFERELLEMVPLHMSHPSLVVWVIYNEGWGQLPLPEVPEARLTKLVRELDPSRLINSVTGWNDHGYGDFHDNHHYSAPQCGTPFYSRLSTPYDPKRIAVQGEFGGVGHNLTIDHLWPLNPAFNSINETYEVDANKEVWNYRALRVIEELREQTELFSCSGGVYTQTTDVEGETNGFLSYDRRVLRPHKKQWQTILKRLYATAKARTTSPPPEPLEDFVEDLANGTPEQRPLESIGGERMKRGGVWGAIPDYN